MKTPTTTLRLDAKTKKAMDRLITDPPDICIDGVRGAARNRTELVEVLVKKAIELQASKKDATGKKS